MKKVCTVGSATQDIFMLYEGADSMLLHTEKSVSSSLLLAQGAKIDIPEIEYALGGGAANVAAGLSLLDNKVEAFVRIGSDSGGTYVKETLHTKAIGTTYCTMDDNHSTALSVIIPTKERDQVSLCYRGANRNLNKGDFPLHILQDLDLLYVAPLAGKSQELFPYLARRASELAVIVAANPSMEQLTDGSEEFIDSLAYCDILIVNARESGYLLRALLQNNSSPLFHQLDGKRPALFQEYVSFGDSDRRYSIHDVTQIIAHRGPKTVIITNGADGVYMLHSTTLYFHPSIATEKVYSLGAGDAFNSGFLGGLIQHTSLEQSLMFGIINASSVLEYPDANKGLLGLDTLQKKVAEKGLKDLQSFSLK